MSKKCLLLGFLFLFSSAHAKDLHFIHDFGEVSAGTAKEVHWGFRAKSQEVRVKEITVTGPSYFLQSECGDVIPAHQRCRVGVRFAPLSEGVHTGRLMIDFYTERFIIDLSGLGVGP